MSKKAFFGHFAKPPKWPQNDPSKPQKHEVKTTFLLEVICKKSGDPARMTLYLERPPDPRNVKKGPKTAKKA